MNTKFDLGKIVIPISEEVKIEIEDLHLNVTDLNLQEYMQVLKEIPALIREIQATIDGSSQECACQSGPDIGKLIEQKIRDMKPPVGGIFGHSNPSRSEE